jgi:thioredoxin 1
MPKLPIVLNARTFADVALERDGVPVLVHFWAAGCPPCRTMAPVVETLAAELEGKVVVARVNVDAERRLADAARIRVVPTLVLLQNGEVKDVFVGFTPRELLRIGILRLVPGALTGQRPCSRRGRVSRAMG